MSEEWNPTEDEDQFGDGPGAGDESGDATTLADPDGDRRKRFPDCRERGGRGREAELRHDYEKRDASEAEDEHKDQG